VRALVRNPASSPSDEKYKGGSWYLHSSVSLQELLSNQGGWPCKGTGAFEGHHSTQEML